MAEETYEVIVVHRLALYRLEKILIHEANISLEGLN